MHLVYVDYPVPSNLAVVAPVLEASPEPVFLDEPAFPDESVHLARPVRLVGPDEAA